MTTRERQMLLGPLVAIAAIVVCVLGFVIGRSSATSADEARAAEAKARQAALAGAQGRASDARRGQLDAAAARGRRNGTLAAKRRVARREEQEVAPQDSGTVSATPPSTGSQPKVNVNCPPGQEPTKSGGCKPYSESGGQIEPKISDPRCYQPDYPPECF